MWSAHLPLLATQARIEAMRGRLLLFLVLVAPSLANADEVYRWVDDQGEVNYTNDPDTIPPRFRTKAKITKGAELGVVPSSQKGSDASAGSPAGSDKLRAAADRVKRLEGELHAARTLLKKRVEQSEGRPLSGTEVEELNRRVSQTEAELARAKEDLSALSRKGSSGGSAAP
jgi:hypothetical protein